ncbi:MAG: DUF3494 domain-containing protein [Verrucomicrobia bacterium]|nr:DUF3494 domain-containing protein [Verrucomicrobiota bacterium]
MKVVLQDFGGREAAIHLPNGKRGKIFRAGDELHSLEAQPGSRVDVLGIPFELTLRVNAHVHPGEFDFLSAVGDDKTLAGSAITINGTALSTTITGDIGSNPTASVTGLGNINFVTGANRSGETAFMESAKSALDTAYSAIAGQSTTVGDTAFANGATLGAGVYSITSNATADITGTLTLNGDSNAVFIFKMSSTLITANGSQVLLTGGARFDNVFWRVVGAATLGGGSSSVFEGNVLASTAITLGADATVHGRLLAQSAAVTLNGNNTITAIPEPAATSMLFAGLVGLVIGVRRIRRHYSERKLGLAG